MAYFVVYKYNSADTVQNIIIDEHPIPWIIEKNKNRQYIDQYRLIFYTAIDPSHYKYKEYFEHK